MLANPMSARTTFCLLFFLNFLAGTLAAPAGTYDNGYSDQGNTAKIRVDSNSDQDSCSFKFKAPLCSSSGTCLSPPPKSSKPVAVVLGVGTQNYTCTSPTQKPTPNGAIATLYDITKSAGLTPDAAHAVSTIVMALSTVQNIGSIPPGLGYPKIGEHHFESNGGAAAAAVFNVRVQGKNLKFVGGRLEGIAPPANSFPGTIDWLKLGRKVGSEGESHGIKFVYRVYTAGGKAPATCAGLRSEHTVKYATEYWFYN